MGISFIILSYNQYKNIIKILNSIRYSQITDYEIIIVDNNSTDFIFEKVQEYIMKYKIKCQFINNTQQKNQSRSRNLGVKLASKEYIYFIDGDDYLNSYFLSNISLKNDIVFVPRVAKTFVDEEYRINKNNIELNKFYSSPVGAFYRKSFLLKYNIWHEENKFFYYSEDLVFSCLLFDTIIKNNIKYTYINEGFLYFGIKRETSTQIITDLTNYYLEMQKYILDKLETIPVIEFLYKKTGELIEECIKYNNQ